MNQFPKEFLLGAATAAYQVEGNNIHSDYRTEAPRPDAPEKALRCRAIAGRGIAVRNG